MARSTFRSVTYDLDASIAVARQVAGSPDGLSSEDLARALGYSGARNGAFLTRLANARLFGVVAGSSSRVTLTDRGALAASPDTQLSGPARVEAFLAVPLFRAVMDHLGDGPVPGPEELASLLRDRFGEVPSKARASANKLSDSARQAGILQRFPDDTDRFTREFHSFTDFTDDAGLAHSGDLLSPTAPRRAGGPPEGAPPADSSLPGAGEAGTPMDSFGEADGMQPDGADGSDGIWLEEPGGPGDGPGRGRRRLALVLAVAVCLAVVAVPVSLALTGSGSKVQHRAVAKINTPTQLKSSPQAVSAVLSALSATTDSGNFDFSYTLNSQAGTATTPTTTSTTTVCQPSGSGPSVMPRSGTVVAVPATGTATGGVTQTVPPTIPGSVSVNPSTGGINCYSAGPVLQGAVPVTGSGVINVNPSAMVTSATVGGGLNVVLRENETNYWEDLGGGQATLAPGSSTQGSGSALGGFASLVSGTLGVREGPVAMMSLSSPSGYLDLYQSEVTAAEEVGPGTVAGTPVTVYKIPVTPAQEGQVPGSSEETQTIAAALSSLQAQGYTGTTVKISIDAEGYILRAESIANFSDGGTVDLTATFSNFGCAGTVLMPGQTGSGVPPANCTSPVPPTPTTSTPTTTPSTPTTAPSTTPGGSTTSTTPGSTPPTTVAAPTTVPSSPGSTTTTSTSAPGSTTTAAGG